MAETSMWGKVSEVRPTTIFYVSAKSKWSVRRRKSRPRRPEAGFECDCIALRLRARSEGLLVIIFLVESGERALVNWGVSAGSSTLFVYKYVTVSGSRLQLSEDVGTPKRRTGSGQGGTSGKAILYRTHHTTEDDSTGIPNWRRKEKTRENSEIVGFSNGKGTLTCWSVDLCVMRDLGMTLSCGWVLRVRKGQGWARTVPGPIRYMQQQKRDTYYLPCVKRLEIFHDNGPQPR